VNRKRIFRFSLIAIAVWAGAVNAEARDLLVLAGRTYTFEELEPSRAELDADLTVRMGLVTRAQARTNAVLNAARALLARELPGALGAVCDTEVTEGEIAQYAAWWERQAEEFRATLSPASPEDVAREARRPALIPTPTLLDYHDPADPRVANHARGVLQTYKQQVCLAGLYPSSPFGANATFVYRRPNYDAS
jgi:hypothetical protein